MGEERPQEGGVVTGLGTLLGKQRQGQGVGDRILGPDALTVGDPERPDDKAFLVTGNDFGQVAQGIGAHQQCPVLLTVHGPHLPTLGRPGPHMDEGRDVVVGDHIPLAGLNPERQCNEAHLVAEQAAFEMSVKGHQRPVGLCGIVRLLAEPERERGETSFLGPNIALPPAPAHELQEVEAVLRSVLVEGHQRIEKLGLRALDPGLVLIRHPRRETPTPRLGRLLPMEERTQRLAAMPGAQRQREFLGERAKTHPGVRLRQGGQLGQPTPACEEQGGKLGPEDAGQSRHEQVTKVSKAYLRVKLSGRQGFRGERIAALRQGTPLDPSLTSWVSSQVLKADDEPDLALLWESKGGLYPNGRRNGFGGHSVVLVGSDITNVLAMDKDNYLKQQEQQPKMAQAQRAARTKTPPSAAN